MYRTGQHQSPENSSPTIAYTAILLYSGGMGKTITRSTHPLLDAIAAAERLDPGLLEQARDIQRAHREQATSDVSVVAIRTDGTWRYLGPQEDNQHLLTIGPEYMPVYSREQSVRDIAMWMHRVRHPDRASTVDRLRHLARAAAEAQPMVEVLLAVGVARHVLVWDSAETLVEAARRLTLDWAWSIRHDPHPHPTPFVYPVDVFTGVLARLDWEPRTGQEYALAYLSDREGITTALDESGIQWGGTLLDAQAAADRVKVSWSTWRAYTTRRQAPEPDTNGRWRPATIDAWRLTRRDITWWTPHRLPRS